MSLWDPFAPSPISARPSRDRIVWLDLEMYSLEDPRVLECAVVLTTCNSLQEIARRNWTISVTAEEIQRSVLGGAAGDFHRQNSLENGLLHACLISNTSHSQWQAELYTFLTCHCQSGCRLAGFSPHVDREVLRTQAPNVYNFLSHKIIDISSLDIIQWGLPALEYAAHSAPRFQGNHRAMADVEASIVKLKWYQSWLRNNMKSGNA